MNKPIMYEAKPTRALVRRIFGEGARPLSFIDWDYIAQCVHAHRACRKLAEYLTEKVVSGEPLSDDVVCFLVMGVDRDQLINNSNEVKGGEKNV